MARHDAKADDGDRQNKQPQCTAFVSILEKSRLDLGPRRRTRKGGC
jgi:hypothetical protein